jgi:hypothetical protein
MRLRGVRTLGSLSSTTLVVGLAASAAAEPLDLSDPTPRTVLVEFETSWNPLTIGQVYSAPVPAGYSAVGGIGTLVISSADYAAMIASQDIDYFGYLMTWLLVAGSASPFTLEINLATRHATAQLAIYTIDIQSPVQQLGTVQRVLSTTAVAGFNILPQYPNFPFFCTTCIVVPGSPYDPATGKVNAVGYDELDAPDVMNFRSFSRAGDLRLSETQQATPAAPALSGPGLAGLVLALAAAALIAMRTARTTALGKASR